MKIHGRDLTKFSESRFHVYMGEGQVVKKRAPVSHKSLFFQTNKMFRLPNLRLVLDEQTILLICRFFHDLQTAVTTYLVKYCHTH